MALQIALGIIMAYFLMAAGSIIIGFILMIIGFIWDILYGTVVFYKEKLNLEGKIWSVVIVAAMVLWIIYKYND